MKSFVTSTCDPPLGATIRRVEEENFSVFAPNSKSLQETMDKISELTAEKVIKIGFCGIHETLVKHRQR